MKKQFLIEDNELRYGAFIGFLSDISSNEFRFYDIWQATKHLFYYKIHSTQEYPYCDCEKIQRDIKRAVTDGYLTKYGKGNAFKYVKTEKLLSENFIVFRKGLKIHHRVNNRIK